MIEVFFLHRAGRLGLYLYERNAPRLYRSTRWTQYRVLNWYRVLRVYDFIYNRLYPILSLIKEYITELDSNSVYGYRCSAQS
jgi:hypothetical protein